MIIDVHCHVLPEAVAQKTEQLFRQRTGNKNLFDFSIHKLLEVMGSTVDKAFINNVVLRGDLVPRASNWVAEQVRQHPDRLVGMYSPHPDVAEHARELERAIKELGFKGVKLNSSLMHYYPEDPRMRPFWEKANELKIPVLCHAGRNVEDFKVQKLDSVRRFCEPNGFRPMVKAYPGITFILAHFAGAEDWWDIAVDVVTKNSNVYTDMSMMFERLSPQTITKFIKAVGAHKVLYGSDYPGYDSHVEISKLNALDLTDKEKIAILSENAVKVFKLN